MPRGCPELRQLYAIYPATADCSTAFFGREGRLLLPLSQLTLQSGDGNAKRVELRAGRLLPRPSGLLYQVRPIGDGILVNRVTTQPAGACNGILKVL